MHIYFLFAASLSFCYSSMMENITISSAAQKLGIVLSTAQIEQFNIYQRELLKWNTKINLISEKSAQEILFKHFMDSLTALRFIDKQDARILDIGSGAGFPGIPLKIAVPSLQLYLLESNRKKVSFLKHIIRLLNLTETFVLHDRAENVIKNIHWKGFFDVTLSRAAFKLPELLSFGAFFLAPQGKLIALKGADIDTELINCVKSATMSNYNELFQHDINSSLLGFPRKIIVGKKIKNDKNVF